MFETKYRSCASSYKTLSGVDRPVVNFSTGAVFASAVAAAVAAGTFAEVVFGLVAAGVAAFGACDVSFVASLGVFLLHAMARLAISGSRRFVRFIVHALMLPPAHFRTTKTARA
jgi:hypothetical protein